MRIKNGQSAEQDHFDLLPFIGIMMCLLGALLLVTMCMGAINIGAGAGIGLVPEPDPGAKIPVLIEWDGKYAVWHSESGYQRIEENFTQYVKDDGSWYRVDPDGSGHKVDGPGSTPMDPLVSYLEERRQTHYAFFAVRKSGFKNFLHFQLRFELRKIEVGSEPFEDGKPIRLVLPGEKAK